MSSPGARIGRVVALACAAAACMPAGRIHAAALDFPSHPLRMIVPYSPGANLKFHQF